MVGISVFLTQIVGFLGDYLKNKRERSQTKLKHDIALHEAKTFANIKLLTEENKGAIAWQNISLLRSGWRSEFFTIVLSLPIVLCFFPGYAHYIKDGFEVINNGVPDWYKWSFLVTISSAFGYRKLADFMNLKKGV